MNNKSKIAIFLTALNEQENLPNILDKIDKKYKVYLVDDGSVDRTRDIVIEKGGSVVSHKINLGQGLSFITGLKVMAYEKPDYAIHIDADGQHNPDEIPLFIKKFETTDADIVQGSRILGSDYQEAPFFRRSLLPYVTWTINKITGYEMTDSMCGFRAIRGSSLEKAIKLLDKIHEPVYLAAESWIRFSRGGLKVVEVPVAMSKRRSGKSRKGLFKYGWGVSHAIIKTLLEKEHN